MSKNILIILDDVHLEGRPTEMHENFANLVHTRIQEIKDSKNNPILICAGDISENDKGMDWIKQFDCESVYVCGNHEFWNHDYYEVIETLKEKNKQPGYEKIHFLHNESVIINGTRFLGATLWSDLGKSWAWIKRNYILKHFYSMADFRKITARKFYQNQDNVDEMFKLLSVNGIDTEQITNVISKQLYNPFLQITENQKSIDFIEDKMIESFDGQTVVVTHHLPVPNFWMDVNEMNDQILSAPNINNKAVYEKYMKQKIGMDKDILMMGFYVNNAYQFFEHNFSPDIWIHGHFHKPVDAYLGTTRIVSNPVGYMKQSTELKIKEIELGNSLNDYIENSIKSLQEYPWEKKINTHLRSFEEALKEVIELGKRKDISEEAVKSIFTTFKRQHESNLKEVEKYVSQILYNLIRIISKDIELPNHLYVTSFVSGFSRFAAKNKVLGIELLNFAVNEHSFISDKEKDKLDVDYGNKLFHYSQWNDSITKIIGQTFIFKDSLVNFLNETRINPKLEENYINNID